MLKFRYSQKVENFIHRYFYFIIAVGIVIATVLEFLEMNNVIMQIIISPLISCLICLSFFTREKKPLEELISFFLFPIFFSVVLQPLTYFFTSDSTTSFVLQALVFIPISNIVYAMILVKRDKMSLKGLGHLVTTVQAVLFVSTIIGFLIKNPLLFNGFFTQTTIQDLGIHDAGHLAKLSLANVIEGFTQTMFVPYLFSATAIKGWVEYRNFKGEF